MEGYDKNEAFILSKHSSNNTSLSVPKIAFGAGNNRNRRSYISQEFSPTKEVILDENTEDNVNGEKDFYHNNATPSFISENVTMGLDGTFFPSLDKVLMNKSGSPLSQYNFYAYLRQDWHGEENLNFWLDVVTHENLFESWREYQDYVKKSRERRKSENTISRRGKDKEDTGVEGDDEDEESDDGEDWEPSNDYIDSNSSTDGTVAPSVAPSSIDSKNPVVKHSSNNRYSSSNRYAGAFYDNGNGKNNHEITVISEDRPSSEYKQPQIIKRVNEEDLAKSALVIYKKYGHMNILPEQNRITMQDLIERQGRFNPVVFSSAKSYVYHIMNVIYFPKFIQSAIDMNLTHTHAIIALPLGIVALTFGLALELYYIFVGLENRLIRLWGFLPIWLGWILLQTAATRFLPPLIIFGVSEHKLFRFHKIKERSILYAHRKRALTFTMWDTLAAIITTAILFAIPPIALYDGNH
ncbi:hypothetical protein RclHR1_05490016 [Rhizophagus clarus]|uniref:Regulator of G protein signaling superfamily n=1 Tax=Rhizophagus clarus TaxID=94130 RepID=A0A2Z6RT80_9GLOM|nr:hypothetical protein RclHR1_05490016 [Rhizophagus clarus]GES83390.1 regulator of G protein signaling superfamily [Rhizophagus clarus]